MLRRNERGFNLFTALVSFLLITLVVLLVQAMISTERRAADNIASIESKSRLEAAAEMARADAMQLFNYSLRKKIEDWLIDEERGGLTLRLHNKSWEEIQDEFAASKFGGEEGSNFANFAAASMEGIFERRSYFGKYTIDLEVDRENLKQVIDSAISKSLDDFFTVIDCPGGNPKNCPKGTFYVNLHLERLSQEEYEKLPKLKVIDNSSCGSEAEASCEKLKMVILPRTTFRIYVPLRFFKAIAEARALTHFPMEVPVDSPADEGLFSPQVHNEIETYALGMCDYGKCAPREIPWEPVKESEISGEDTFCPGDNLSPSWSKGLEVALQYNQSWCNNYALPAEYNANNNDGLSSLQTIANARVCEVVKSAKSQGYLDTDSDTGNQDKFSLVGKECEHNARMLAYEIMITVNTRGSKKLGQSAVGVTLPDNYGRNLGLWKLGNEVKIPDVGGPQDWYCSDQYDKDYMSKCVEVKRVEVTLAFREEDPNYMVRELGKSGEERIYRITVSDSGYVPFNANRTQGPIGVNFLYGMTPQETGCSFAPNSGWYCSSVWDEDPELGEAPQTIGCRPPKPP